jgi:hypothetical protein
MFREIRRHEGGLFHPRFSVHCLTARCAAPVRRAGSRLPRRQGLPEESVPDLGNWASYGGRSESTLGSYLRVSSDVTSHAFEDLYLFLVPSKLTTLASNLLIATM